MEVIKATSNLEFDVIYADGTRNRVEEGILWEVKDEAVTFHLGTSRLSVLFAAVEDALRFVDFMDKIPLLADYLLESPECDAFVKLLGIAGAAKRASFRLGQMDMRDAAVRMLRDLADGTRGLVAATLIDAADRAGKLEIMDG